MSSIAALVSRRAFARHSILRAPPRRFYSASKMEEADLEKGPKRDPELYVCPYWTLRLYFWIIGLIRTQVLLGVMSGAFLIAGW